MVKLAIALALVIPAFSQTKPTKPADNWQKSKECAAKAEKFAAGIGLDAWVNHYSPKYNKCFVKGSRVVSGLTLTSLSDPFERSIIAYSTVKNDSGEKSCFIEGGVADCAAMQKFVQERMEN